MKPDIIRQPLLLAIASILVVIAAAMTTGTTISPAPETMISTPLGDLIGLFQERFPRCSRILCGGLLLLTGILCGRLAVRYGLYPVSSTLTIPLYGLVACGILLGREYLTESVAAFVLLLSTQNFFACFRNGYAIGAVFRASFFLGLLPLLYAPLLPLPLLVLAAAFCFRRTLREVFVSLCSVVLPFLAVCYIEAPKGSQLRYHADYGTFAATADTGFSPIRLRSSPHFSESSFSSYSAPSSSDSSVSARYASKPGAC